MSNRIIFFRPFIIFPLCMIAIMGCMAHGKVFVNGYLNGDNEHSLSPEMPIYIAIDPSKDNPLLQKEVANKIKSILQQKGYQVSDSKEAPLHLAFNYAIGQGAPRTVVTQSFKPGEMVMVDIYNPATGKSTWTTIHLPGQLSYSTRTVDTYAKTLSIRLLMPDKGTEESQVIWTVDAVSIDDGFDLRKELNYLLVAAFKFFGEDTGEAKRVVIEEKNPLIQLIKPIKP